jgi:hypothetical protein
VSSEMSLGPGWWRTKWQVMQTRRLRLVRSTSDRAKANPRSPRRGRAADGRGGPAPWQLF